MVDWSKRAEKAGYKAVLLTADLPVSGRHKLEKRASFSLPEHLEVTNFSALKKNGFEVTTSCIAILPLYATIVLTGRYWIRFFPLTSITSFCSQRNIDSGGCSPRSAAWGSGDSCVKSWREAAQTSPLP